MIDSAILYEKIFNKIREILDLEDITKPMNTQNRDDFDLLNPYGKMTCLILNLFSMEFGVPPLYAEVNRVCRVKDMKHIQTIGPFIQALKYTLIHAERNKEKKDIIRTGKVKTSNLDDCVEYNISGAFIAF